MRLLDYLYFSFYKLLLKTSLNDIAEYVAFMWLALLLGINLIVIVGNIGINPLNHINSKVYGLIVLVPLFITFYFLFLKGKRYVQIAEHYANETKQQRLVRNIIAAGYMIATFAALILL